MIRIGLTISGTEVRISSQGAFYLMEKKPEAARRLVRGILRVDVEGSGEVKTIYRVQVASLSSRPAAEELGRRLSRQFSLPAVVRNNDSGNLNQIRIGEFPTNGEASEFASRKAADAGFKDAFVVRETVTAAAGSRAMVLRGPEDLFLVNQAGYLFMPANTADFLRFDGRPYRGILDLSLNRDGRITTVNELPVEEYLLGVVPAEISPSTYPESEALAAQAVAARTYALKNSGRFRSEGFDLTDDTRTQVYGGAAVEVESSSEAVRRTSGWAIYYRGELIEAMYCSTCGGRTEDFSDVFDALPVPYLKSVFCKIENSGDENGKGDLTGNHELSDVLFSDEGSVANRGLELARVFGLTGSQPLAPEYLAGTPGQREIEEWLHMARLLAGKTDKTAPSKGPKAVTRADFLRYASARFFGADEIEHLISPADEDYYLANLSDGGLVPGPARRALAYLMQQNLWHAYPDNRARPNDPLRRSDALTLLVRWIEAARPDLLRQAILEEMVTMEDGGRSKGIVIKQGRKTARVPLNDDVRLYRVALGKSMPAEALRVIGNEKIRFHQNARGEVDFLEVELNPTGASNDRFSPAATWETSITRLEASKKLQPLAGGIGEIQDLKPARFGKSGRVVQLELIGRGGSVTVNGYKARNALGLKDTLYVLSRTRDPNGGVQSFTFKGRGWGHGVGMCQVGAYGMARAGHSYEEILKTYYQGVELRKAY